ncbi:MAG: multifunctional oxoglutarate decarboxylase/oxoglutarate dehydrogenase thiamine pyrophosphate-binding subunit/dihydrolipoyllysine-residue succinyltransferase subunit [Planctomycetes bacterium]|nr:multifunctional oxoglutarate decarboxylase/oxoglutarate dehydrogenase thiamine pyrophosphate-binding subunit/dihydrolipoyllysine-residue succinyltransferase subunit [Planctomycetota bacterium]MCP4770768.1 multifunctional oxoglutarate decarboxylase/oxoglutarate dehydrogenase thiamine pyrophosphate-binding subunit/dihydrolipoyllysine-residue succinyltransferase subunit [Planctomycetota bacterium]MCP4862161.1 multifunctional oxoglutarate decarboxylase/oxoglutarate dehydrogenase thiamine pyrophosp
MKIDFEEQFGVNAGYVEDLFETWRKDPSAVDEEWALWFSSVAAEAGTKVNVTATLAPAKSGAEPAKPSGKDTSELPQSTDQVEVEPLRGIAAAIAKNMNASLEVPTATTVRTIPVKVLDENRRLINAHMRDRALGKASYTHFIAYAMVRAVSEMPNVQSYFLSKGGKSFRMTPKQVNLGMAIDVGNAESRSLVVPNIKDAGSMNFKQFYDAYQDVVARGRGGKLGAADFAGTTFSLTNPGGFGTESSIPRLMQGQGLILATGAIGVPVQTRRMDPAMRAELAIGPVMTITSTYDHRTVQGAESGLLLKRVEELLDGADGFWNDIFSVLRVPWTPAHTDADAHDFRRDDLADQARVWKMINAYRSRGCQLADLDPLEYKPDMLPSLDPGFYGFTIWDLDRQFLTDGMCDKESMTLREILDVLRETYCRRWTIEHMHIVNRERKTWVRDRVEMRRNEDVFDSEHRLRILERLTRAENFERFLHTRYPGNKRFSLEGADTLIPALCEILDRSSETGVKRVVIGMAHRGRLNVLANILNKSYQKVFNEFEGVLLPGQSEGSGDVKYHLGQRGFYTTPDGQQIEVILSANPSHLEAVNPVVCGQVRAYQDLDQDLDRSQTLAILIHGDAAFTGQGVVTETLQMCELPGFAVGGTIHLVVNNQIGFTAGPRDLFSTYYCTDLAKMVDAPILHANGDYPEAVMRSMHVATDFRSTFHSDVVIDMVCYRRRGHNEGDEPMYTQPLLYRKIAKHSTVREHYTELLVRRGMMTRDECVAVAEKFDAELREAMEASREEAKTSPAAGEPEVANEDWCELDWCDGESPNTGVQADVLVDLISRTNAMPEGHVVHPNLLRQLKRREEMIAGDRDLDWGCAETAAMASLVTNGVGVRLVGQDSGRGTFSHRHAVIRDQQSGQDYVPLDTLNEDARFEVRDSLLSEEAVLGFEYGYGLASPEVMGIWEAQFGDFANGAQIPIDQFLASGEEKWGQRVGLTMLLPHGYDGQGPEHSNARPERFLQLCAEGNFTVANCSTASQYFHLLRRQGLAEKPVPMVVFTPKSLLRDPRAASPVTALGEERFQEVMVDDVADDSAITRVILCSGKVYHDLADYQKAHQRDDVALVRLEQLYPFPRAAMNAIRERFPEAHFAWCQEEPRNMGGWSYALQRFGSVQLCPSYSGRPAAASPATGSYKRHHAEQARLLRSAFGDV